MQKPDAMTSLILGCGFIGSHLAERLSRDCDLRILSHSFRLEKDVSARRNIELIHGNYLQEELLKTSLKGVTTVFHLVSTTIAQTANRDPIFDVTTNVCGSIRLLQACVEVGVRRVVFISSGGTVYGSPRSVPVTEEHSTEPVTSYGIAKLAIEKYLALFHRLHGLDYRVLRLSNPYGEGQLPNGKQGAVAAFVSKALRGESIPIWGDGSVVRDYLHIDDVIEGILAAAKRDSEQKLFNLASGVGLSLNEIVDAISAALGTQPQVSYADGRSFDVPVNVLSIEKARQYLGWTPKIGFEEGLKRTISWQRALPP